MNGVKEVSSFFTALQDLCRFFGTSIHRWDLLQSVTGESEITLKQLNPTRWAGRIKSLIGLKVRYKDVMKALCRLVLESTKKDERDEASRLKKSLERFEFVLILVVVGKILSVINLAFQYLQTKNSDLVKAAEHLQRASVTLSAFRTNFILAKHEAIEISKEWGIECCFAKKRIVKHKHHFDELAEDTRLVNSEDKFRITVFNAVLGNCISQLKNRIEGMRFVAGKFSLLQPKELFSASDKDLRAAAVALRNDYPADLSEAFAVDLLSFPRSNRTDLSAK